MIFSDLYDFICGPIPLGLWLLPLVGIPFTGIWWFAWKGTGFWDRTHFWKVLRLGWTIIILAYIGVWTTLKPQPIPHRVLLIAGEVGQKAPGAYVEACADAVRRRLQADESLTIIDAETAPVIFERTPESDIASTAARMRVRAIIRIRETGDPSTPKVALEVSKWTGFGFAPQISFVVPASNLARMTNVSAGWAEKEFGLSALNGHWPGSPVIKPDSILIPYYLAFGLRRLGQVETAAGIFAQNAARDSLWPAPRIEFARTWLTSQPGAHEDDIRRMLLEAVRLNDRDPETYILLGRHFLEFRDWEEAESSLKLAYNYAPFDPRVFYYLARLMPHRLSDLPLKTPEKLLERALELAPGYQSARLILIDNWRKADERRRAFNILAAGVAVDPTSPKLLLTESALLLELRKYNEAIDVCQRLLRDNPTHADALYNLGLCRLWKEDFDGAIAAFDSSYKCGGTIENLYYIGGAYQFKGDYPTAISWFQKRFAAAKNITDKGAVASRKRINSLREMMVEDSLIKRGAIKPTLFDKAHGRNQLKNLPPPDDQR